MFSLKKKVYYHDTDCGGVVYYANYLVWFEVARTEFLKSRGISYKDLEEKNNLYLMVVESQCRHIAPATYDDSVAIETWISQMKNSSMTFEYKVFSNDKLIAEGETAHVFINKEGKPTRIPQGLKATIF